MSNTLIRHSRYSLIFCLAAALLPAVVMASGYTAHQFAVSESGAATVTIPLQVPRGIGGMEPQLSLNYSSEAGNGLLGLGWNLAGPSAVTRCAKALTIDGERGYVDFTATNDRFCLDGQRLILQTGDYGAAGSTYVTERDSFSVITALGQHTSQVNVPASFRVETKSGLVLDFGLGQNSRTMTNMTQEAKNLGRVDTINRWMLQRISDLHGSFVEFVYCAGTVSADSSTCDTAAWAGSAVLHYVRYTNRDGVVNGQFGVIVQYEARPDKVQVFHAGAATRQTQRIKSIETYADFSGPAAAARGSLVRRYAITYDPLTNGPNGPSLRATNVSRIVQVQEWDASGNSLPPVTFSLPPDKVLGAVTR